MPGEGPRSPLRDGALAVAAARKACELTGWFNAWCIGTLAAACAEAGDFDQAEQYQRRALAIAVLNESERPQWQARAELYRQRQPYRQPAGN